METNQLILKKLGFLIDKYKMEYIYDIDGNQKFYRFKNDYGSFSYYEYRQLGEVEFSIKTNEEYRIINFFEIYPKLISRFNQDHKGIKWFFGDKREDYWEMISQIIKSEIELNHSLFGLRVE